MRASMRLPVVGSRLATAFDRSDLADSETGWPSVAALVEQERPDSVRVEMLGCCVVRDLLGRRPFDVAVSHRVAKRPGDGLDQVGEAGRLDADLSRPVPGAAEALRRMRAAGSAVTFIAPAGRSTSSASLLADLGLATDADRVVSVVEGCDDAAVGGDPPSDREVWDIVASFECGQRQAGSLRPAHVSRTVRVSAGEPIRYERAMASRPGTAGPAIAAAARSARLAIAAEHELNGDGEPTAATDSPDVLSNSAIASRLEILGAEVAGQAFTAFLLWVADRARNNGMSHLAFLSRDGELPLRMAEAIPADHWGGASLGYLHCSRWSWLLSGASSYGVERWLELGTADSSSFIHSNRHRTPFVSLLGRIGLGPSDLAGFDGLAATDQDRPLQPELVDEWEALLADPAVRETLAERGDARRRELIGYLETVGLPSGKIGLVDVGWRGRLAWSMSPVIAEVTGEEPLHLHFGGDKVHGDVIDATQIARFAFDGLGPTGRIDNPVSCVETLTASGRARVVGYEPAAAGTVSPVFEREVAEIQNADRRLLWQGAIKTAANLPSHALLQSLGCTDDSLAPEAVDVLGLWWTEPRREEADAMRGLAFEADDDGRSIRPVVAPYSPRELAPAGSRPRQWQQGSAAVTPRGFGHAVSALRRVRDTLRTVVNRREH